MPRITLGVSFRDVSLGDTVRDPEVRKHIKAAESEIDTHDFEEALGSLGKAFAILIQDLEKQDSQYTHRLGFACQLNYLPMARKGGCPNNCEESLNEFLKMLIGAIRK